MYTALDSYYKYHYYNTSKEKPTTRPPSRYPDSIIPEGIVSFPPHETEPPATGIITGRSSVVPRNKRRGLLGQLSFVAEIENPKDYGTGTKNFITILAAAGGAAAPMGINILLPALGEISKELHATESLANLSVALYILSVAICPLWWSKFSEMSGRRTVYIISFSLFVVFGVCSALAVNIGALIAFRVLSGAASSSVQSVGAGTISDIWDVQERGKAMGWFYLGPLCGPLLSPVIGGVLTSRFGWRSTQWFLAMMGVVLLLIMLFCLPETHRRKQIPEDIPDEKNMNGLETNISQQSMERVRRWTFTAKHLLIDPLKSLKFLRFPPVLITVLYSSITFTCFHVLNMSIQASFSKPPYNFSTTIVGLLYIPSTIGYITGSQIGGRWSDNVMKTAAVKRRAATNAEDGIQKDAPLVFKPEDRMGTNVLLAGVMYPCAVIFYGWFVDAGFYWLAPMAGTVFFGFGSMLVFNSSTTMLTEFVPGRSSSVVAVNSFVRNICACIGGIVTEPLIFTIGNGWLFTITGVAALCSASTIWIMRKYGPKWRSEMYNYDLT